MFISSCSTSKLVMKSDHVIASRDGSIVIIRDNAHGKIIYNLWSAGYYGEPLVLSLIDSTSFYNLFYMLNL